MKEILFRGKRKDNGQWIYGVPCSFIGLDGTWCDCIIQETEGYHSVKEIYDIIPETLGQFTGLTDRNGNKIFKGDILQGEQYPFKSDDKYNYFAEVIWFENSPAFGIYTFKNPESKVSGISTGNCEYMEDWDSNDWEVFSNIHDNPELLGVIYDTIYSDE